MTGRVILFGAIWLCCLVVCSFRPEFKADPLVAPPATGRTPDEIAHSLRAFVPGKLMTKSVPGVSVAVVRNGKVIYREGFGVTNAFTRSPVTPDTVFEAASISKPVTAYAALQLVEQGRLQLDTPLSSYLTEPYVEGPAGASITLRQALTHTSGLGNQLERKPVLLQSPGASFSYSGQGFLYAGRVVETITGEPLDSYLESKVLPQLQMTQSGYVRSDLSSRMATPHIAITLPLLVFTIPAFAFYLILSLLAWIAARVRGKVAAGRRVRITILALSVILSMAILFVFGRTGNAPRFAVLDATLLMLFLAAWRLWPRNQPGPVEDSNSSHGRWRRGATVLCILPVVCVLIFRPPLPLRERPTGFPAAAGLRATATDLAKFLSELMDPQHIGRETMAEMLSDQVVVNERTAWGLGIGIQKGDHSRAIWHWGINYPGFQALMVAFPEQKLGVVVLTNGGPISITPGATRYAGLELAREIAFRAIGGEHYSYWQGVQ